MEKGSAVEESPEAALRLYQTRGKGSVEIVCGGKVYKVHAHIACSSSAYFRAAFSDVYKEGRAKRIELPDDPFLVARMIQVMYSMTYADTKILSEKTPGGKPSKNRTIEMNHQLLPTCDENGMEETWLSRVNTNVQMYILADKYGFDSLKSMAVEKLAWIIGLAQENPEDGIGQFIEKSILREVPLVYDCTLDTDRGLRNLLLDYVTTNWVRLSVAESLLDAIAQAPVFAVELITAYKPTTIYEGKCQRCYTSDKWTAERVRCICGNSETVLGGNRGKKHLTKRHIPGISPA